MRPSTLISSPAKEISMSLWSASNVANRISLSLLGVLAVSVWLLTAAPANAQGNDFINAVDKGDVAQVKAQLAAGADVNARNANGLTALQVAALHGNLDVVRILIDSNADVNAKTSTGVTAIMAASVSGNEELVKMLLAAKADVNAKRDDGITALRIASQNGELGVVKILLAAKADVNAKTSTGVTALMAASQNGHIEVVRALLDAGADVNAERDDGATALKIANESGNSEVASLLRLRGASGTTTDSPTQEANFSGNVLHITPSSQADGNTRATKTSDLIKAGISPFNGQFTSPDGIVYSTIELDRSEGKIYVTSPNDKLWKYEVTGLDSGTLSFIRVARQSASAPPASGPAGASMCTISHARGSSYSSAAIGHSGESTRVTVVSLTLGNKSDNPMTLSLKSGIPALRTARKRLEAERILAPNWLPMAGGAGSTEVGCGGMETEGGLEIDKDAWCGWVAINKPGSETGDHISIPANSVTLTVTKDKPLTIKLLFPGDIAIPDAELIFPGCRPSPFRLGPQTLSKVSK